MSNATTNALQETKSRFRFSARNKEDEDIQLLLLPDRCLKTYCLFLGKAGNNLEVMARDTITGRLECKSFFDAPSNPIIPIERTIVDRLADVSGLDVRACGEIGDRAGDFQNAVVSAAVT